MTSQDSTATRTDTKALALAALVAEFFSTTEASAREGLARRMSALLQDEAKPPALPADPDAVQPFPQELPRQIKHTLKEAQLMSESIHAIVSAGLSEGGLEFPMLQAIMACLQRMDDSIDPAIERMHAEVSHV